MPSNSSAIAKRAAMRRRRSRSPNDEGFVYEKPVLERITKFLFCWKTVFALLAILCALALAAGALIVSLMVPQFDLLIREFSN